MPGPLKTEAVVLRSMRYGEADRILHSTPRIAAGSARSPRACGGRAAASAAGWSRSSASARAARGPQRPADGDSAETVERARRACAPTAARWTRRPRLRRGRRALFDTDRAHPGGLQPALQRARAARRATRRDASHANQLAFRLKLLLAAGLAPHLGRLRVLRRAGSPRRRSAARPEASCARPARPGRVPARRGGTRVHDGSARAAARRRAGGGRARAAPGRARNRGDGGASRAHPAARRDRPEASLRPMDPHAAPGPVARAFAAAPSPRGRPSTSRRWATPLVPGAPRGDRGGLRAADAASSATATGSSTPRRSGASSTRPRSSWRPRATTTARGSPTRSRSRRSRAPSRGRCGSTRTSSRRSGSATTSATRRSGTSARTCSTRCLHERFGRGFRHYEHSLRVVDVLERDGAGLNLCDDVRDGIVCHSGRAPMPRTLEGRIVRLVDRVAYINHDIDDALRAGVPARGELPADAIAVLGDDGLGAHRPLVHDLVEHPRRRGDIVQGDGGRARAMDALRTFMFDHVYLGEAARREHAKIETVVRTLFDHYVRPTRALPARRARRRPGPARDRLHGGDDRPLLPSARSRRSRCPRRSRSKSGRGDALHRRAQERVRDAVDMVDLVSASTELRQAGADRYEGLCPFHEERTPSFGVSPRRGSTTASAAGRAATSSRSSWRREGIDFVEALEILADRYGVELEVVEEDPRRPSAASSASGCWSCSSARRPSTCATCGTRDEAARRARVPGGARAGRGHPAGVPRRLRAERVGHGARRRRAATGSPTRDLSRPAWRCAARTADGSTTASAGGSCSRCADERGRVLGFGARALRDDQQPKYLNSSDDEIYHKGRQLFGADIARAPAAKAGAVDGRRGLHRRDRDAPGRASATPSGIMGTALTEDQVGELRGSRRPCCSRSTPTARARRRCCARRGWRQAQARAARRAAAARGATRPTRRRARAPRRSRALVEPRCRSCASGSSASSTAATWTAPRARTA